MRDGFIFYSSFYEALADLDDADRLACYDAICTYAITGKEPEGSGVVSLVFKLVRPQIDANNERRENGKLGGRPKKAEVSEEENHRFLERKTTGIDFEEPKYKEKDKEKVKEKAKEKESTRARFIPPTVEEVRAYCEEKGYRIDAAAFVGYYESQNWKKANGQPVSSWKGCVQTWLSKEASAPPGKAEYHNRYNDFPQRDNDYEKIQEEWIRKSFGAPLPVAGRG